MNHEQMIKPMLIGVAVLLVLGLVGLPVLDYLPLLLLLACPLMMIFMMAGMSHGQDRSDESHDDVHPPHGRRTER